MLHVVAPMMLPLPLALPSWRRIFEQLLAPLLLDYRLIGNGKPVVVATTVAESIGYYFPLARFDSLRTCFWIGVWE